MSILNQTTTYKLEDLNNSNLLNLSCYIAKYDPRIDRCKKHKAETIIFITLCAVICGNKTWNAIADFALSSQPRLKKWLGKLYSQPSHDTFSRFFSLLKPEILEKIYREWIMDLINKWNIERVMRHVISIDGKEIRGARKSGVPTRILSAYSSYYGVSLGQKIISEKSNEIPAMQEIIPELNIKGCIVTADAMHCQKATCQAIIDAKADYFLFVKGNQQTLKRRILEYANPARSDWSSNDTDKASSVDNSHGRHILRTCFVVGQPLYLGISKKWPGIQSYGAIVRENKGKLDIRYFVSSLKMDAKLQLEVSRKHWSIENELHRRLDVDFMEDKSHKKGNSAKNYSVILKMALAILSKIEEKVPLSRKMSRMAENENYFHFVLQNFDRKL